MLQVRPKRSKSCGLQRSGELGVGARIRAPSVVPGVGELRNKSPLLHVLFNGLLNGVHGKRNI